MEAFSASCKAQVLQPHNTYYLRNYLNHLAVDCDFYANKVCSTSSARHSYGIQARQRIQLLKHRLETPMHQLRVRLWQYRSTHNSLCVSCELLDQAFAQGNFLPAAHYGVGTNPSFVISGDLNGNGKLDLVAVNQIATT